MRLDGVGQLEILVGGAASEEYTAAGRTYVDMQLQHATSYDCEYVDMTPHGEEKSTWPVTPFQCRCTNLSEKAAWVELHIDGERVDELLAKAGESRTFEGFKNQADLSEFLFALPRNQRVTDGDEVAGTSRLSNLGTVKAVFYEATYSHKEDKYSAGKSVDFRQANKIEARKCATKRVAAGDGGDAMTGTARAGRSLGANNDAMSKAGHKRVTVWNKAKDPSGALAVHYRQRHVLEALGAIPSRETRGAREAISKLLTLTRERTGADWSELLGPAVATARALHLAALPDPAACYAPTATAELFVKYLHGESATPRPRAGAAGDDERALRARLGGCTLTRVVDDNNSLFSAAALALYGTEDLYFLVRRAAAAAAAAGGAERFGDGFATRAAEGSSVLDADLALQVRRAERAPRPTPTRPPPFVAGDRRRDAHALAAPPRRGRTFRLPTADRRGQEQGPESVPARARGGRRRDAASPCGRR